MIVQRVIKGIGGISRTEAEALLRGGIVCNWWRNVNPLPEAEISQRLTNRNLYWHQNRYDYPDPVEGGQQFFLHTPFISVTAGTVERDAGIRRNIIQPAWLVALEFATDIWSRDGFLFHCYVFILGKPTVHHRQFSEELRELNIYTGFSLYQPEGEITAKIIIPPTQIEKLSFYKIASVRADLAGGRLPAPTYEIRNAVYRPPEELSNIRGVLL
jgi:hypothetical protein